MDLVRIPTCVINKQKNFKSNIIYNFLLFNIQKIYQKFYTIC